MPPPQNRSDCGVVKGTSALTADTMTNEVELAHLDLRYERFRLKQAALEERLLAAIAQRGIEEPLEGVDLPAGAAGGHGVRLLLNGFKRYRCARKLRLATVPYVSLGPDEAVGILSLLRTANHRALSILEQAAFIAELKNVRAMNVAQIAAELCRSKAWVSVRLGLFTELSQPVREKLFAGAFPVYAYMSALRPFMRMNGVRREQIEEFVLALSGKGLSVREVEQLAHGCFRGPASFRQEILKGNVALSLERLRQATPSPDGCSEFERVMGKSRDPRLASRAFHAQSHLLTAGILSRAPAFGQTLKELHDRNGQA